MKNGAIAGVMGVALVRGVVLGVVLGTFAVSHPASAQNAVGGPKKPVAIGGATKQTSPVVPVNKGGSNASSAPAKCPTGSCVVKGPK
jgi:hypothetical protein